MKKRYEPLKFIVIDFLEDDVLNGASTENYDPFMEDIYGGTWQ